LRCKIAFKYTVSSDACGALNVTLPKFVVALKCMVPAKTVSGALITRLLPDRRSKNRTSLSWCICEASMAPWRRLRRARDLASAWSRKSFSILQSLQPICASFRRVAQGFAYSSPSGESSNDIGLAPVTEVVSRRAQTGPMYTGTDIIADSVLRKAKGVRYGVGCMLHADKDWYSMTFHPRLSATAYVSIVSAWLLRAYSSSVA
jgi:hypothetical protein